MTRARQLSDFIAAAGWGDARRSPLAGDASDRRYERLALGAATAVLMDSPPGGADDPAAFVAIGAHLNALGLSAPRMLAQDPGQGFLLLEDLGDDLYARHVVAAPAAEPALYAAAAQVLAHLQAAPPPPGLPDLSPDDWAEAAMLAIPAPAPDLKARLAEALARHHGPRVLILRDYHAENLLWLPRREGLARVGLLDFQLAQLGHRVYDLVSLTSDARRDVPPAVAKATHRAFAEATGTTEQALEPAIAVWGVQRALRILGVFARLAETKGKTGYLALMPRVRGQLERHLAHPALAALCDPCLALLPRVPA